MGGDIDMKSTWRREFIFISIITTMTFAIPTSTIAASPVECEAHARSTARSYGGSTLGGAARGAARGVGRDGGGYCATARQLPAVELVGH